MKLNKKTIKILSILFSFFIVFVAISVSAQSQYEPLAPLPHTVPEGQPTTDLVTYVTGMIKLLIGIAGVLAVIMIMIGGIQYMSTDAISGKEEGKDKITQALLGLVLAVAAWIILNTINPDLLLIKPGIKPAEAPESANAAPPENAICFDSHSLCVERYELLHNNGSDCDPFENTCSQEYPSSDGSPQYCFICGQ